KTRCKSGIHEFPFRNSLPLGAIYAKKWGTSLFAKSFVSSVTRVRAPVIRAQPGVLTMASPERRRRHENSRPSLQVRARCGNRCRRDWEALGFQRRGEGGTP